MNHSFTQFPDIFPTEEDISTETEISWGPIDETPVISIETAVLSWASVLHAYTGNESPAFVLNQRAITANLTERRFDIISLPTTEEQENKIFTFTALTVIGHEAELTSLRSDDAHRVTGKCPLSLDIDLTKGSGILRSEIGILEKYLKQIGGQMMSFLYQLAGSALRTNAASDQLSMVNVHPHELPGPSLLHQLVFSHGLRHITALDFLNQDKSTQSLSYHDLDNLSTQLARRVAHTIGPPRPSSTGRIIVPVLLTQSVELYIAWLAILKAGAAFCPLSTDAPEDRIRFILKDISADMILTHSTFKKRVLDASDVPIVLVDSDDLEPLTSTWADPILTPEDLAYVMYTSGSTGRPKGVAVSHRAATQSLLAHDNLIPPFRRFLQFASPTFDVSVFEVFFPWFRGVTLVGSERANMLLDLPRTISEMEVDAAELTPTVAGELLRSRQSVPSLKVLLTIGEMLTKRVVQEFGASSTQNGILYGMYGPTEATIHCTAAPNFHSDSRVNLIGQPFETVSAFIVSLNFSSESSTEPMVLPVGQIGELVIGGPQLANGYINRPIENSKAFIRSKQYGRLYRTGDKARLLPCGNIECFGRVSTGQIKLRGQRVELGEIESVISVAPGICSTIVGVVGGILVAWMIAVDVNESQAVDIRNYCRGKLPGYMVPGDFITVQEFPRLESGKIDRKALEAEYTMNQKATFVGQNRSFRDPLEKNIAEVVDGIVNASSNDSLSAAGLDSLKGIKLAAKLREIGINLDVHKLLAADSVGGIWDFARAINKSDIAPQLCDDSFNVVVEAALPLLNSQNLQDQVERIELCSDIQLAMLSESVRDRTAYFNWVELKFSSSLGLCEIKEAFCKLIENNAILRSAFLPLDLPEQPFCQVFWKASNMADYFKETTSFSYDWGMNAHSLILEPFKIQIIDDKFSVRTLLHLHHSIYDGWSWELLLRDLQSALAMEPLDHRPPYSAIVKHRMLSASSGASVDSNTYWASYLKGAVSMKFPNFQGRHCLTKKTRRARLDFSVSLLDVATQAQNLSISCQTFFQASLAYLLSYYLDSNDVILGTVFSGRTAPVDGIDAIIGPCLHILPSRVNLSWVRTISDLLTAIQRDNRKALEHGDVPLREIKKISGIEGSSILFNSLLVWQETSLGSSKDYTFFEEAAAADYLEFPLTVELEPHRGKIRATATFDESVLPEAQVHLLLEQIDAIAKIFIQSPEEPLSSVNKLLPSSILSIENDKVTQLDNLEHLAYQVERTAIAEPTRHAIEFVHSLDPKDGSIQCEVLTYHDLNSRSNSLARYMLRNGVASGDLVAVILDKSIDLYVSILAVIKIGAGYVPLAVSTPTERIRTVLNETKPKLCIIGSSLLADLGPLDRLQFLDMENASYMDQYPNENLILAHTGSNTAYVVFTSGSTGKPKGVVITHHNLQSNIATLAEIYPLGSDAKILQACSQAFDVSVFEIFFAFKTGMTLCSATNDIMFRDIEAVIRIMHVTHLSLTPTVAALVRPENVPEVRLLVTAGEGLTAKVHHDWAGKGLFQGYGPCETTNICTVKPNVSTFDDLRNIGKPFKNTSVFVISDAREFTILPRGSVGEFCFGGDQVGKEYLNQLELSKEKFYNHPKFGKLYRSGDFGRLLSDGSLMFTGRRDDQVKLRGQRIELGEVNSTILLSDHIQDCTSMIIGDKAKGKEQLISFFVPKHPIVTEPELVDLINRTFESLSAKLPLYMTPTSLIPVELIPMTVVKKIDTRKLVERFQTLTSDDIQKYSCMKKLASNDLTPTQGRIAKIISEATNTILENLRANTPLYSIGLDSISAIYVSKKLRESGFGQVDISVILRNNTIAQLARAVEKVTSEKKTLKAHLPSKKEIFEIGFFQEIVDDFENKTGYKVQTVIPCTALQEAMLSRNDSQAYWNHILLEFYGDTDKLHDALQKMVQRHETLRTCFIGTKDARFSFAQIILVNSLLPFDSVETTDMDSEIAKQKLIIAQRKHDSYSVPYFFFIITNTSTAQKMLLISIHHAIHDGEAMALLFKEIEMAYEGSPLPPAIQFQNFVGHVLAENWKDHDYFWSEYLNSISGSYLCPRQAVSTDSAKGFQTEIFQRELGLRLTDFEAACKSLSLTQLSVIHASWARLLSLYTLSSDICFGTVLSGRATLLDGVEETIGPCFNVLPIRIRTTSYALNTDLVKMAQLANTNILRHQHTSLRDIQKKFSKFGRPLFDSIVLFQRPSTELNLELWKVVSEEGKMDFPVIIEIIPSTKFNNISILLHVDTSQISFDDAQIIVDDFVNLIIHTIKYPLTQYLDETAREGRNLPSLAQISREFSANNTTAKKNSSLQKGIGSSGLSGQETVIRDIMVELSKCESDAIRHNTTIFQLGLDSINAVQISRMLKQRGYTVSAAEILEKPSMSQIAKLLFKPNSDIPIETFDFQSFDLQFRQKISKSLDIGETHINSIRPCSSVQSGMLAKFVESNGNLYFNRLVLKLNETINITCLKNAWYLVMTRNEILRTGFVELKTPKFPFAMVTYAQEYIKLPWEEWIETPSKEKYEQQGCSILKNIHLPPWRLVLRSSNEFDFIAMHAIYDAQSLELILSEVAQEYKAAEQLPSPVPINPILGHILNRSSSTATSDNDSFWRTFGCEFQVTRFPNLTPFNVRNPEMAVSSQRVSKSLSAINEQCKLLGVSLQASGQAAYARLLSNYTGETNISFGVVFSGRDIGWHAEEAVFPCLMTVPFQCRIQNSNKDLISSIMKSNALLVKNQFTPLPRIQSLFKHDGPLIDTLFVYQKLSRKETNLELWEVVDEDSKIDYPVSVEMIPEGDGLLLRLTYRNDVIPLAQADIILKQLDHLLLDCLFEPDSDCCNIPTTQSDLISITPAKDKLIPSPVVLLHEYVEKTARELPDKIALEFVSSILPEDIKKESWKYSELDQISNQIARLLHSLNNETRDLIAICFDKCPSAYFAILGVLKSGHAYVALDPTAPFTRKQFIIDDSGARIILCASEMLDELQALSGAIVIALDQKLDDLSEIPPDPPELLRQISPQDTCYCLYTSGTTGTPKGCEITHENAVQAMEAFTRLFSPNWDENSRWLQFASFHFDVSVLEQYWSWGVGICVTSCPRDVLFQDLAGTISRLGITHIDLTPSLAKLITPEEVPSLCRGVFITGGEALKQEILDAWGKHRVIYNGYGPTEVTIGCTMLPRMDENSKSSNIGRQFDNVGSYVFKPGTNLPVFRGCIGELCVSGALVGRGYLNRPDLTQERFQYVEDSERKERFYRTGDLVRILYDGSFQFNGRMDDQVKLRGQRLELGEINTVIQEATDDVSEVATLVAVNSSQQKEQLVVFVARKKRSTDQTKMARSLKILDNDVGDLSHFLMCIKKAAQNKLPGYMVPTHIIPIESLPLTPNNKIDAKALKGFFSEISPERLQSLNTLVSEARPLAEKEIQEIIKVLCQFVKVNPESISPSTSIYDMGLDSISAIGLAQHFRDAGYRNAQVSMIMKNPTVGGFAISLKKDKPSSEPSSSRNEDAKQKLKAFIHENSVNAAEQIGIPPESIEDMAPCTPLQEGMIARFLESGRNLYCSSFRFELSPDTDLNQLRRAWLETQTSIQLLRVRMAALINGYAQVVLKHDELPWVETTASNDHITTSIADTEWNSWRNEIGSFSSALWRLVVVKSSSRRLLCLNIFHALYDGNSLPLLLEQVVLRYNGEKIFDNVPKFLEVLPYGPLRGSSGSKEFWVQHLAKVPEQRLFQEPKSSSSDTIALTRAFSQAPGLDHIKTVLQVTENAIFHACWLLALQEHLFVVPPMGIVVSGRALDFPHIEHVVGPLFNTVPSYVPLDGLETRADLIKSCHQYHVSALPFQHTPLRDIMKWMGRGLRNPLFEILFVFQKAHNAFYPPITSNIWTEVGPAAATADFPLSLEVLQAADKVNISLTSQDSMVSAEMAEALLSTFERICKEILLDQMPALPNVGESLGQNISCQSIFLQKNSTEIEKSVDEHHWTSNMIKIRDVVVDLAEMDVDIVNPGTSIFELGLDSIDAIKLSSRLKKDGLNLSVSSIMKQQTILKMSESSCISKSLSNGILHLSLARLEKDIRASLEQAGKLPSEAVKVLPLTALQESMVAEMVTSEYQNYYGVELFEVMKNADFGKLLTCWKTAIDTHPILRTCFVDIEDPKLPSSYVQVVYAPNDESSISIIDLKEESLENLVKSKTSRDIHPAFSVHGVRKSDKNYIILSMAHALYDGWSLGLLHEDVEKAYYGDSIIRPSYEPVLERILDEAGEKHWQFWKAELKDFIPRSFPAGNHANGNQFEVHRAELRFGIPSDTIKDFCRVYGITVQALSVTTWTLALASYVKSLDVSFGLVVSGRSHAEADEIMFPTMNTVVFRSILHGSRLEMLKYAQSILNALIEHQHFPLRRLGKEFAAGNLFDTLFIYQKRPTKLSSRRPIYKSINGTAGTGYPLALEMELVDDSMVSRIAVRGDLFGMKDANNILQRVAEVFQLIVSEPQHATIEHADGGMRICGSAIFQEDQAELDSRQVGDRGDTYNESWTTTELIIRQVLSVVSGVPEENIYKDSTIFHLGLDSISAIKVCSLLKKQSILLPVSSILRAGSIHKMATAGDLEHKSLHPRIISEGTVYILKKLLKKVGADNLLLSKGISPDEVEQILPVTAGQIYCLSRNVQDRYLFYSSFYFNVSGISKDRFVEAWKILVIALPILRTVFLSTGHRRIPWIQTILKHLDIPVCWHETTRDIKFLSPDPRSVSEGPVSLQAVKTGQGLIINIQIHHALYDAVSLSRIINYFENICIDTNTQLEDNMGFEKFILYQNDCSPVAVRERFWKTYLEGVRPRLLPEVKLDDINLPRGDRHEIYRPGVFENIEDIELVSRRHGLSLQSLFMAIYARIHSELTEERAIEGKRESVENQAIHNDFVIGIYLANRGYNFEGLQTMISPTLNMVPLRIERPHSSSLSSSSSLIQIAHQIQRDLHEISRVEHSGVSLLEINDWTGLRIDAFVNFLKLPDPESDKNQKEDTEKRNAIRFIPLQADDVEGFSVIDNNKRSSGGSEERIARGEQEQWKEVYMNCIDVEAAVRGGKLDVGVFGPETLLSKDKVEMILSRIQEDMEYLLIMD